MIATDDALHALELYSGWPGGQRPVDLCHTDGSVMTRWLPANTAALPALVRAVDEAWSPEILIGLPRRERRHESVGAASVVWARVEGSDQVMRAQRFRPLPTIVLKLGSGSTRIMIWALDEAVSYFPLVAANRRIAYSLGAKQSYGEPDAMRFPAPGSCLRVGRARPAPVVCTRLSDDVFTVERVVGHLREPPAPPTREEIAEMKRAKGRAV